MAKTKKPELKSIDFDAYVDDNRDNLSRAEIKDLNKIKSLMDEGEYGVEFNSAKSTYDFVDKEGNIYGKQTGLKEEGDIIRRTFGGERRRVSNLMGDIYRNKKYLKKFSSESEDSTSNTEEGSKPIVSTSELPSVPTTDTKELKPKLQESSTGDNVTFTEDQKKQLDIFNAKHEFNNKKAQLTSIPTITDSKEPESGNNDKEYDKSSSYTNIFASQSFPNAFRPNLNSTKEAPIYIPEGRPVGSFKSNLTQEEKLKLAEEQRQWDKVKPQLLGIPELLGVGATVGAGGAALYSIGKGVVNQYNNIRGNAVGKAIHANAAPAVTPIAAAKKSYSKPSISVNPNPHVSGEVTAASKKAIQIEKAIQKAVANGKKSVTIFGELFKLGKKAN